MLTYKNKWIYIMPSFFFPLSGINCCVPTNCAVHAGHYTLAGTAWLGGKNRAGGHSLAELTTVGIHLPGDDRWPRYP